MEYVLVTGASTGLGEQICKCLAGAGYQVLAGVRKTADGERLQASFGKNIHPLLIDVTDQAMINNALAEASAMIGNDPLVAIINNAGIVVSGAVLYVPTEEWQRQFDVNLYGVIRVTNAFFALLSRKRGAGDNHPRRIVNMSSISGLFSSPFLGPYAASKFALEAMSDALRRELYMYDIQVVLIEPGNIRTPIWEKAKIDTQWLGPEYDSIRLSKDRIIQHSIDTGYPADVLDGYILKAIRNKAVRPRYLVKREAWKFRLIRMLPTIWLDGMIRKRLQAGAKIRPF
jgi:NAD(P)-dependent dehydrogenase (short-subunit alcohol dehydrogenase family)